jgi:hypothetical protein
MLRKQEIPCKATFRIGVVITAPINGPKGQTNWIPVGTINDAFTVDLSTDSLDERQLAHEVVKMLKVFKEQWQNVVTLENLLAQEILKKSSQPENQKV